MKNLDLLALHRRLVSIPSISHEEKELVDDLEVWMRENDLNPLRIGDNLVAVLGEQGPVLCLNSHLDTVPPSSAWTQAPHDVRVQDGKVYGLGSNDAKASVAAMIAAFYRFKKAPIDGVRVMLALVVEEETGGKGAERLLAELPSLGLMPSFVVVGEPTSLDIAVSQKGLLILELSESGQSCHAAHGRALGANNALRLLAQDLVKIDSVQLGSIDPELGPVTLEPTVASGGTARNMIPAEAICFFDIRTNPGWEDLPARLRVGLSGDLKVFSSRLRPCSIDKGHLLVRAAQQARPQAKLFGSRGVSDLAFFSGTCGIPGIKVGPGVTERSHTPDEFVLESEILDGGVFYENLLRSWALLVKEEES